MRKGTSWLVGLYGRRPARQAASPAWPPARHRRHAARAAVAPTSATADGSGTGAVPLSPKMAVFVSGLFPPHDTPMPVSATPAAAAGSGKSTWYTRGLPDPTASYAPPGSTRPLAVTATGVLPNQS